MYQISNRASWVENSILETLAGVPQDENLNSLLVSEKTNVVISRISAHIREKEIDFRWPENRADRFVTLWMLIEPALNFCGYEKMTKKQRGEQAKTLEKIVDDLAPLIQQLGFDVEIEAPAIVFNEYGDYSDRVVFPLSQQCRQLGLVMEIEPHVGALTEYLRFIVSQAKRVAVEAPLSNTPNSDDKFNNSFVVNKLAIIFEYHFGSPLEGIIRILMCIFTGEDMPERTIRNIRLRYQKRVRESL